MKDASLHTKTWRLVKYGGNGIEHLVSSMSGSVHFGVRNIKYGNRGMARKKKCYRPPYGMAIHH